MELNLLAYDDDNNIVASYILDDVPIQDVELMYHKNSSNVFTIGKNVNEEVKKIYDIMLKRSPSSDKYDVRIKKMIVEQTLENMNSLSDFDDLSLNYKTKFKFNVRGDVLKDYKFVAECTTIKDLLQFFEEYKEFNLGLAYLKPIS